MRIKVIQVLILFGILIVSAGCSVQNKLIRDYKGKTHEDLVLSMGKPTRTENMTNGRKIDIYVKSKYLKAAPISTGQFQYDQLKSPSTTKTEIYKFYINSEGIIDDVKYEISYER
jgi:hypothetical protein